MTRLCVHLFTTADNATFDLGRVLWAAGVVWYLVVGAWAVIGKGQAFDPSGYGTGLGLVLAGGGGALALKAKTEPGA